MEHSGGIPSSPTSDILTEEVMQPEDTVGSTTRSKPYYTADIT
jgi:hypothetical protein